MSDWKPRNQPSCDGCTSLSHLRSLKTASVPRAGAPARYRPPGATPQLPVAGDRDNVLEYLAAQLV